MQGLLFPGGIFRLSQRQFCFGHGRNAYLPVDWPEQAGPLLFSSSPGKGADSV